MTHPLAALLISHRASGTLVVALRSEIVPQTIDEVYQIHAETVASQGPIGAWKVSPVPETGQPIAAPILAASIFADGAALRAADFPGLGIEVEVAVTIDRDFPAIAGGYTPADMRTAIGSIHIALELLASRFVDRSAVPRLAAIADLQSNGGIALGAAMPAGTLPEFGGQDMVLTVDGVQVGATAGDARTENVLAALAWLANHAAALGLPLKAGNIVITGARLGPLPLNGKRVEAHAGGLGSVKLAFD